VNSDANEHLDQFSSNSNDQLLLSPVKIVETAIYATDLTAMEDFYVKVLNLHVIDKEVVRHIFFSVGPGSVLLIFNPESTQHGHHLPAHGAFGAGHVAFGVPESSLAVWRERLLEQGIAIEREQSWPRGGHSIYFRDPAGNSIELITPRVWGTPSGW
jgi:catechol 2,3-dioxygenase-like lactoylglutathione lyase family enzyme